MPSGGRLGELVNIESDVVHTLCAGIWEPRHAVSTWGPTTISVSPRALDHVLMRPTSLHWSMELGPAVHPMSWVGRSVVNLLYRTCEIIHDSRMCHSFTNIHFDVHREDDLYK